MTTREKILENLTKKGWPVNRLAQLASDNKICTRAMVHRWLSGGADIGVSKAEKIWDLLKMKDK
jgi:hypothetical protein